MTPEERPEERIARAEGLVEEDVACNLIDRKIYLSIITQARNRLDEAAALKEAGESLTPEQASDLQEIVEAKRVSESRQLTQEEQRKYRELAQRQEELWKRRKGTLKQSPESPGSMRPEETRQERLDRAGKELNEEAKLDGDMRLYFTVMAQASKQLDHAISLKNTDESLTQKHADE